MSIRDRSSKETQPIVRSTCIAGNTGDNTRGDSIYQKYPTNRRTTHVSDTPRPYTSVTMSYLQLGSCHIILPHPKKQNFATTLNHRRFNATAELPLSMQPQDTASTVRRTSQKVASGPA